MNVSKRSIYSQTVCDIRIRLATTGYGAKFYAFRAKRASPLRTNFVNKLFWLVENVFRSSDLKFTVTEISGKANANTMTKIQRGGV